MQWYSIEVTLNDVICILRGLYGQLRHVVLGWAIYYSCGGDDDDDDDDYDADDD